MSNLPVAPASAGRLARGARPGAFFLLAALACGTRAGDFGLSLRLDHQRIDEYTRDGQRLLNESGPAATFRLAGETAPIGPFGLFAAASFGRSRLHYDGRLQTGAPITTTTRYRRSAVDLGGRWRTGATWSPRLALRAEENRRTIESVAIDGRPAVAELAEVYRGRWLLAGVDGRIADWRIEGEVARLMRHRQTVASPGIIDHARIDGADGLGLGLRLAPPWPLAPGVGWRLGFDYRRQARSAPAPYYRRGEIRGEVTQPATRWLTFGLEVAYTF